MVVVVLLLREGSDVEDGVVDEVVVGWEGVVDAALRLGGIVSRSEGN